MKITKTFFDDIRALIVNARATVARGADLMQVYTNFEIGRRIVEQEQKGKGRAAYGKEIIKALADRLTQEFGEGFSKSNLEYMRRFFLCYEKRLPISQTASGQSGILQTMSAQLPDRRKTQTVSGQFAETVSPTTTANSQTSTGQLVTVPPSCLFTLSWSHYVFLLGIKNPEERCFYEIESSQQNWSVRELKRQFDSSLYERLALSRDKDGIRKLARKGQIVEPKTCSRNR